MKRLLPIVSLVGALLGTGSAGAADTLALLQQRAELRGYRVLEVRWDPVLQQRWVVLQSVAHPELPLRSELTSRDKDVSASGTTAAAPVFKPVELAVRSGDRVVLWSAEQNMRMQMGAVAEGNAAVGDRVQLRVTGAGVSGDGGWRVAGIVRGPGSVEMER